MDRRKLLQVADEVDGSGAVRRHFDHTTKTVLTPEGSRPFTPEESAIFDEIAAWQAQQEHAATLKQRAATAISKNLAWLQRSTAPSNLEILAHLDLLTRQNTALLRTVYEQLDSLDGTNALP